MYGMRKGRLEFGPANTTALLFETLMDSKALSLTPNTTSVYMTSWIELQDEPIVIETPANVLGIIDDHWFHYVTDFGNAGADKAKGGKYLFLPPGFKGNPPDGYFVLHSLGYRIWARRPNEKTKIHLPVACHSPGHQPVYDIDKACDCCRNLRNQKARTSSDLINT